MNEELLEKKLQEFQSSIPNVSPTIINEIIQLSCQCIDYEKVITLLELYNAQIWPKYRILIVKIIDGICKTITDDKTLKTEEPKGSRQCDR